MKTSPLLAALLLAAATATSVRADPAPKHSADYAANHRTLVEDQKAAPDVADCIATGDDYVRARGAFDRLGFTRNDIAGAEDVRDGGPFSASDHRPVARVITVAGEARQRDGSGWLGVTLRCGFSAKGLTAIEIETDAAQD